MEIKEDKKLKNIINFITGVLATWLVYLLGGWDIALQLLVIGVLLDYITGICKAIYKKKLNSEIGLKGIVKKIGYFVLVAVAVIIDKVTGETGAIRTLVIYFFVANEGISILENWGDMGVPFPKKLREILEQLRDNNNPKTKETK